MDINELKESVLKLLCTGNDLTTDEAEELITESLESRPDLWDENADPKDLAMFLASDGTDD